jgi:hypothetical protein
METVVGNNRVTYHDMGAMRMNLDQLGGLSVYPRSLAEADSTSYCLARSDEGKLLVISGDVTGFEGEPRGELLLCPLTPGNARALRQRLPWLRPQPLGLDLSAGCGDRLGLATPGHIQAVRDAGCISPILAQQSMRENARTGRTPQQVVDDAMWGVFQEGWRMAWGADADHLKTTDDVDLCVAAGYTFFTVDPGDHVDNEAHTADHDLLVEKVQALPWDALEDTPAGLHERYLNRQFEVEDLIMVFDQVSLARAASKYGKAIAHTVRMYRHLESEVAGVASLPDTYLPSQPGPERSFELEVSVDETETPTSPLEHLYIASELRRLGVEWVSLAPRYIGRFEKGVDYIGDLDAFEIELAKHASIARALGPYKLSIHSGSDKFSVYPIFAHHAGGLVHLKTAGTSYLEGLRAIAVVDPSLFRAILAFARECYDEDKASYHVSADPAKVPLPGELANAQLAAVLDSFDGREVLHVTFGSVLDRFGEHLLAALDAHEEAHYAALATHFNRHFSPFIK